MSGHHDHPAASFPRFVRLINVYVSSYKICLFAGLYAGTMVSSYLASTRDVSPTGIALLCLAVAAGGLLGTRSYFLLVNGGAAASRWRGSPSEGGMALFGALPGFVALCMLGAWLLSLPPTLLLDILAGGVIAGGPLIRFGCVLNGCCGGRPTDHRLGVKMHDTSGHVVRRIPVQYLEILWWLAAGAVFAVTWPLALPHGSYGCAMLAGYGAMRFVLEPLRQSRQIISGSLPVDQLVALILMLTAAGALALITALG